jgi:hypothetical protein
MSESRVLEFFGGPMDGWKEGIPVEFDYASIEIGRRLHVYAADIWPLPPDDIKEVMVHERVLEIPRRKKRKKPDA